MEKHKLYNIWAAVPVTYYQSGVRKNLLQKIWHNIKIATAKNILGSLEFESLLDVGCASGYMVSQIQKSFPGKKYYGVDIYDKAIKFAKQRYPSIRFKVGSADKLPFKEGEFDLITCYETIEHVENPGSSLKEMRRVLKKRGTLILAMDSGNFMFRVVWFVWEKTTGKVWEGAHLHPFKASELEQAILKSGFKIKDKLLTHLGMEIVFILKK